MPEQLGHIRHNYIRYANCWEDADVLLRGLDIQPGNRVLSIGSAGDNSFSLLTADPEIVVAVDINPVQLRLIELKKAAFLTLEHSEFLVFLGFEEGQREKLFTKVIENLSAEARDFWLERKDGIQAGIIHQGKFERYFQLFHGKVLPLIHTTKRIDELFEVKPDQEQARFYNKHWNTWRWRALFRFFFSRFVMGRFGRDPAFLDEVQVPVSNFILNQSKKHLSSSACQHNYFLRYILHGRFGSQLPHYARKENFNVIKSRLNRLQLFEGLAEDVHSENGPFDRFNLSNIFEYMNPELFKKVSEALVDMGKPGSRYAYWNLMVPRLMSDAVSGLHFHEMLSIELTDTDNGFFYKQVCVDEKR